MRSDAAELGAHDEVVGVSVPYCEGRGGVLYGESICQLEDRRTGRGGAVPVREGVYVHECRVVRLRGRSSSSKRGGEGAGRTNRFKSAAFALRMCDPCLAHLQPCGRDGEACARVQRQHVGLRVQRW